MKKESPVTYYLEALVRLMRISPNWMRAVISRFITKQPIVVQLHSGLHFSFDPKNQADLTMMVEVFSMESYNPPLFEIQKSDIVFDIGAHVGYFSLYASEKATEGKVYSFEPMNSNYSALSAHISGNKRSNIEASNIAIGGEDGEVDFYLFEGHNGCHSLYERQNEQKTIRVQKKKLETVMKEFHLDRIDFLKLDCEGAEYEIFDGMSSETFSQIGKISMEIHPDIVDGKTGEAILSRLKTEGFLAVESKGFIYALNKNILK